MSDPELPFLTRLWFAWACFLRVLFDGAFAARAFQVREALPAAPAPAPAPAPATAPAPAAAAPATPPAPAPAAPPAPAAAKPAAPDLGPALQLLALLQREGRLVDFLEQDVASFPDAEIGAAARVVHEGCRKALRAHATLAPVRAEEEGARVSVGAGFAPEEIKLTGNVKGAPPYQGTLVHKGWRATAFALPTGVEGHDARVLAPAEVEL